MNIRLVAVLFAATFIGGIVLSGEQLGAFADSTTVFEEHYASVRERTLDLIGAYALAASAFLFLPLVRGATSGRSPLADSAGVLFAASTLGVATLLATVPGSLAFGAIFGDPGLTEGLSLPPSIGYVLLTGPAALAAAVAIAGAAATTRRNGAPGWWVWASFGCAALLLLGPFMMPLAALPAWALATAVAAPRAESRS